MGSQTAPSVPSDMTDPPDDDVIYAFVPDRETSSPFFFDRHGMEMDESRPVRLALVNAPDVDGAWDIDGDDESPVGVLGANIRFLSIDLDDLSTGSYAMERRLVGRGKLWKATRLTQKLWVVSKIDAKPTAQIDVHSAAYGWRAARSKFTCPYPFWSPPYTYSSYRLNYARLAFGLPPVPAMGLCSMNACRMSDTNPDSQLFALSGASTSLTVYNCGQNTARAVVIKFIVGTGDTLQVTDFENSTTGHGFAVSGTLSASGNYGTWELDTTTPHFTKNGSDDWANITFDSGQRGYVAFQPGANTVTVTHTITGDGATMEVEFYDPF